VQTEAGHEQRQENGLFILQRVPTKVKIENVLIKYRMYTDEEKKAL
jgi:hypothetical protein